MTAILKSSDVVRICAMKGSAFAAAVSPLLNGSGSFCEVVDVEAWNAACKAHPNIEPTQQTSRWPTMSELATNFTAATARWVKAGMPVVGKERYDERMTTCKNCQHWKEQLGIGRCQVCGCTKIKLWLATECCPKGLW